jgi:hypothetical protein
MYKFPSILLLCFVAVLLAQDQASYKNAFGWESGLSYRRYISHTMWVGVNVTGSYNNTLTNDTEFNSTKYYYNDSTFSTNSIGKDTNKSYSGTIKIEFGKVIFKYKLFDINAFIAGGYTIADSKSNSNVNQSYVDETLNHSILGIIALVPEIILWNKIGIGTQIGLQYAHTYSKYNYHNQYNDNLNDNYINTGNKSSEENTVTLLGNVTSNITVHYYF